jgi:hypothetical protein
MRRQRLTVVLLLAAATLAVAGARLPIHVVWQQETGTQLLWNGTEGHVFISRRTTGWSGSCVELLWQVLRNGLGASTQIRAKHSWLTVFRVRADEVDEFTFETSIIPVFDVFEDQIYDRLNGALQRWTGRSFEAVDAREQQRYLAGERLTQPVYSAVAGWSGQVNLLTGAEGEYVLNLEGGPVRVIAERPAHGQKEIRVGVRGRDAQRVWFLDEGPQYVSSADYDSLITR